MLAKSIWLCEEAIVRLYSFLCKHRHQYVHSQLTVLYVYVICTLAPHAYKRVSFSFLPSSVLTVGLSVTQCFGEGHVHSNPEPGRMNRTGTTGSSSLHSVSVGTYTETQLFRCSCIPCSKALSRRRQTTMMVPSE